MRPSGTNPRSEVTHIVVDVDTLAAVQLGAAGGWIVTERCVVPVVCAIDAATLQLPRAQGH